MNNFDNPVNDNMAKMAGKKAIVNGIKAVIKSNNDAFNNFMAGTVSGMKEINNSFANNSISNSNNSNKKEIHNHYNVNFENRNINNNQQLNNSIKETVSLGLAAKTLR